MEVNNDDVTGKENKEFPWGNTLTPEQRNLNAGHISIRHWYRCCLFIFFNILFYALHCTKRTE